MNVLIFDDDPNCAELIARIIHEMGGATEQFHSGEKAVKLIQERAPAAVVLDIMMAGMDGLSICRALKRDPATARIKVFIASGKKFTEDRDDVRAAGADAFIEKPFKVGQIRDLLAGLVGAPAAAPAPAPAPEQAPISLRVWGSRGPGDPALATATVDLEVAGRRLILDAGSGLRAALDAHGALPKEVWLLLTHHHEDHICGLRALGGLGADWAVKVVSPPDTRTPVAQVLAAALAGGKPKAAIRSYEVSETRFQVWPEVWVSSLFARHPGATLAYQVEHRGRRVVYCPDNELEASEDVETDFTEKFRRFIRGADLLIHDARWLDEDYPQAAGKGHGSPSPIVETAATEGVRRLALFHMDARYSARQLEDAHARALEGLKAGHASLKLDLALPGTSFSV